MGLLRDLDRIFGDFAGKTIHADVTETRLGNLLFRVCDPKDGDPVMAAIERAAARQGLELRLNFPGNWKNDASVNIMRVNAMLEDVSPGVFRVAGFAQG